MPLTQHSPGYLEQGGAREWTQENFARLWQHWVVSSAKDLLYLEGHR